MFEVAEAAVQAALDAGARYADARVMHRRNESMSARNGDVEDLSRSDEDAGIGVRALVGSGWGFFAVPDLSDAAARAAGAAGRRRSPRPARCVPGPAVDLVPTEPVDRVSWASECAIDPLGGPAGRQGRPARPRDRRRRMRRRRRPGRGRSTRSGTPASGSSPARGTASTSTSGSAARASWPPRSATARPSAAPTRRTAGSTAPAAGSWSTSSTWPAHAPRIAEEARALLTAPLCPAGETTLILGSEQLALQIHESVGHAIELDRILGWEAAFAGTSWLDLAQLGSLRYGSELMNITDRPDDPGRAGLASASTTRAPRRPSATRSATGIWVGVLAGRDSAAVAGLDYAGSVRADGWARLPMVRMTNVGLEPGPHTLEEIIAATDDGIFMDTNRSWSIDDRRLNFQFGCEIGYEIKNGKRGRMLRNPTYTGIGPQFWQSMDMLSSRDRWRWGTPNCGKGQPGQVGHTGHPAAPARFTDVRVGVRG